MEQTERQTRIAQLRGEIEALQQELARLEHEEDQPYQQYTERARASGQTVLPPSEFHRYTSFHEQLEQEWIRLGRPRMGWPRMAVFLRLRGLLQLPPLDVPDAERAAARASVRPRGAGPAAPAAPTTAVGAPTAGPTAAPRARAQSARREQLMEMHGPILNEVVELTKRAAEELRLAKVGDGITSAERAMYLLDRVAYAPAVLANQVVWVVDEALRGAGIPEADRARLVAIRDRATKLAIESPPQP
ncbi:MAG TPA: hypothetical protein VG370_29845 [Chloroflexota bacterium]|jgi:hypothetical protein|nr:hypothetical protein [Chloroflexota bacterium]